MSGLADLDGVTLDANGTLVQLVDPVPKLVDLLREHGAEPPVDAIRRAVAAEGMVYAGRAAEAHDPEAFAAMQRQCTSVFLAEAGVATLDPVDFAPLYVGAMEFVPIPGVADALVRLRRSGLALAVVANFDLSLRDRLDQLGLTPYFSEIVTPGDAGAAKPDPRIFELALERLGVAPERALHIGDRSVDEEGARAAGMQFEWAPVTTAVERWTA